MSKHLTGAGAVDVWIVTVCLNDVVGLSRTLWSIAGQQGVCLGVVIADGGSDDGSLQMATAFAHSRTNTVVLPGPDRGIYHGMNRGLAAAPGDPLLWFLNAGDFFTDGNAAVRALSSMTSDSVWVGGPIATVRPSGAVDGITAVPQTLVPEAAVLPAQPSVIARKSAVMDCGGFREDLTLASDGILIASLAERFPLAPYTTPSVFFELGGRSSAQLGLTLQELRSATPALRRSSSQAHKDAWSVFKTRVRRWVFALEIYGSISSSVVRASRRPGRGVDSLEHWPHPRPGQASTNCCRSAASRFLDRLEAEAI